MTSIDPKAAAAAVGAALAGILWTLLAIFVGRIGELPAETITGLTGSTALVFTIALAYMVPNLASRIAKAAEEGRDLVAVLGAQGVYRVQPPAAVELEAPAPPLALAAIPEDYLPPEPIEGVEDVAERPAPAMTDHTIPEAADEAERTS